METDKKKLFIGGISQETTEEKLKEYFGNYGRVKETEIPRDRITGNRRGFGFVTFNELPVANDVLNHRHTILGRTVEVKHAQPKGYQNQQCPDQQQENNGSYRYYCDGNLIKQLSKKKIFVGGLPPSLTQEEFKNYFESFGATTDVVVMHDKETNRPRGFGFITFDTEEAVDAVLQRRFYKLGDKDVEVKRAEPKDMSTKHICNGNCNNTGTGFERFSLSGTSECWYPYATSYNIPPDCSSHYGSFWEYYYGTNSRYGAGFSNSYPKPYGNLVSYPPYVYGGGYLHSYMNDWASGQMGAADGDGSYRVHETYRGNGRGYANGGSSGPVIVTIGDGSDHGGGSSGPVLVTIGDGSDQRSETTADNGNSNENENAGDTELPTLLILEPIQPQEDYALCIESNKTEQQNEALNGSDQSRPVLVTIGDGSDQGRETAADNGNLNENENGGDTELPTLMILEPIPPQEGEDTELPTLMILEPIPPQEGDALCTKSNNTEQQNEAPNGQRTPCESS